MAKVNKNTIGIKAADLVRGANDIAGLIQEISKSGKALDRAIQVGLCSVIVHSHKYGDYTQANNIIDGLNKGARTNAARDFICDFAPVRWNKKTSKFVFDANKQNADFETSNRFAEMMTTDWLSYRAENVKDFTPFDTVGSLENMIKRVTKAKDDDRNDISDEEMAILNNAFKALNALRAEKIEADKEAAKAALVEALAAPLM